MSVHNRTLQLRRSALPPLSAPAWYCLRLPPCERLVWLSGFQHFRTFLAGIWPTRSSSGGPGAGAEVTAGGVFSDLLRLAAFLDGPS